MGNERKEVLNYILGLAVVAMKKDKVLSKEKIVLDVQFRYGRRRAKVEEYFRLLEDAGKIRVQGDEFWLKGILRTQTK